MTKGKTIKFGNSFIDFENARSFAFSINPIWRTFENGENNSFYYVLSVWFDCEETSRNYCGSKNDLYEFLVTSEALGLITEEIMPNINTFIENLKRYRDDYDKSLPNDLNSNN